MERAAIVVDLGFGDAGKGLVTDHLVRSTGARLVVRFHGGAQAGHNVVTPDGRHHTFAQIGAGTFVPGVETFLSHAVVVHPTALLAEASHLAAVGVPDALERLFVSERALVITPFHQAANRLRELGRGARRHGSCGVGVGETVADALRDPGGALRTGHLRGGSGLREVLFRIQDRKREEVRAEMRALAGAREAEAERGILEDSAVVGRWLEAVAPVLGRATIVGDDWLGARLAGPGAAVFEGAQGVLLDEWAGFHPYTTWSTCTFERACELLAGHGFGGDVARIGVLRTYSVRHGAGPMPAEDPALDALLPERHNGAGPWQGRVRRGWPDLVLARYAVEVCGGVDAIALTHLDAIARVPVWQACRGYTMGRVDPGLWDGASGDPGVCARLRPPGRGTRDLDRQAALGEALLSARPVMEPLDWGGPGATGEEGMHGGERVARFFEERLGAPVRLLSWGPAASDVRERGALLPSPSP